MQVSFAPQPLPLLATGFTPAPAASGNISKSTVLPPVAQGDGSARPGPAGQFGKPRTQERPEAERDGDSDPSGDGPAAGASSSEHDATLPGRVGRRAKREGNGGDQGQGRQDGQDQSKGPDGRPLDPGQQQEIRKLEARNRQVRAHEAAHQSVGGQLAGAASYTYQRGPNGKLYAIGGEVPIKIVADPNSPQKTIARMQQVIAAALAPADPSSQDRAVAARATQIMLSAQRQLASKTPPSRGNTDAGSSAQSNSDGAASRLQTDGRSAGSSPVGLYADVAQLVGTPSLKSSRQGIAITA